MVIIDTTQTISSLFVRQAQKTPDAVALQDVDRTLTYAELEAETATLASRLRRLGVGRDSPVGVLMERSADYVVACLAALRAGGAFLVLELAYPPGLLADVIANAEPKAILTHEQHVGGIKADNVPLIVMDGKGDKKNGQQNGDTQEAEDESDGLPGLLSTDDTDLDRLCFVSYSSGTTGKPKGIANPHSAPVRSYDLRFQLSNLDVGDRVACNVFFVWEILRPLIRGATVFAIPDAASYDPVALVELLSNHDITDTLMTPTLLSTVLSRHPDMGKKLPKLKTLWLNGEVVTTDLGRRAAAALPNTRMFNCYSASETHEIACGDIAGYLDSDAAVCPVGPPVDPSTTYIVDEAGKRVAQGEKGELYVGGALLARGYLNLPDTTARAFLADPYSNEPGARMYRTGDLARILANGDLEVMGRVGAMIKMRGYSIQPPAVEAAIVKYLAVSHCAVVGHGEGLERQLVAYIVEEPNAGEDRTVPAIDDWGHSPNARRTLAPHLAHYMIPVLWVRMDVLPTHEVSGKADLKALPEPPAPSKDLGASGTTSPHRAAGGRKSPQRSPEMETIARLWATTLGISVRTVSDEHTFFDLGGHSLTLADLSSRMTLTFGFPVPLGLLAERPTLEGHATVVRAVRDGHAESVQANLPAILEKDCVLDDDIRPVADTSFCALSDARTILLTGVTGFLGAFLLHTLMEQTTAKIVCLVRFADPSSDVRPTGMARLRRCLVEHGVWSNQVSHRVEVLPGNLAVPNLGFSEETFDALALRIDAVVHAGAAVNLIYPYNAVRNTNVDGTRGLIRLACKAGATFNHVSTNGVLPASPDGWSETDSIPLADVPTRLLDGYGQTKWVAEQLVLEASRRGLPVRIYRPGTLSGDSDSGATNSYDLLNAIIVESLNLAAAPSIPDWLLEMTPVDFVARAIVGIGSHKKLDSSSNCIFHIGDPKPPTSDDVFRILASLGYPVEQIPFDEWTERWAEQRGSANVGDDAFTTDVLKGGMPTAEALKAVPVLGDTHTAPILKALGLERPAINIGLFETYARHFYSVGWVSHPPAAHLRRTVQQPATNGTTGPKPPAGPLSGRVAVVTGASSGIGAAVAAALATQGVSVALGARRLSALETVRDGIHKQTPGARLLLCQTDVTDHSQVERLMKEATDDLGPIDVLVACAGVMYYTMMANAKVDQWAQTVSVNCAGFLNTLACSVPRMLARGPSHPCHVVAISSDAGRKVFPGLGVYSASKFFVEATLQSLRLETVGSGLRVTSIQPGNVETPLLSMSTDKEALEKYAGLPQEGEEPARVLKPQEVADAIVWALNQPAYVAVNEVLIEPREQPI